MADHKRGESLGWTEKALKENAEIAPADIERARVMWRTNAPKEAEDILDAEPQSL